MKMILVACVYRVVSSGNAQGSWVGPKRLISMGLKIYYLFLDSFGDDGWCDEAEIPP